MATINYELTKRDYLAPLRTSEPRPPVPRTPEPRMTEPRMCEPRTPEPRTPEPRTPEPRTPEPRTSESSTLNLPSQTDTWWCWNSFRRPEGWNPNRREPLRRKLRNTHVQLISLGGAIGTGFLVASGEALQTAGPLSLLLAFAYVGVTCYFTIYALGEMVSYFPEYGAFATYSGWFIDQAWGGAMGWNYALQWLLTLPLELLAASITLSYWSWGESVSHGVWAIVLLAIIVIINLFFGVLGFGHIEACISMLKVIAIIGFICFGILYDLGVGWEGNAIGFSHWYNPGSVNNGFLGFCDVIVVAAVAYSGTELVGLTAAETREPKIALPKAVKAVFWRILLFYILGILLVGLLVPYTNPNLLSNDALALSTSASPFVIAVQLAGAQGLPSIVNAIILVTIFSVANTAFYSSTRTLHAMACNGHIRTPEFPARQNDRIGRWRLAHLFDLSYVDRKGRPMVANLVAIAFGMLSLLSALHDPFKAFQWLLSLSGISVIITWASICRAHIQFRRAFKAQGRNLEELDETFRSPFGIIGSWIGLVLNLGIIVIQFITGVWPIGYDSMTSNERAMNFFQDFMAVIIVLVYYFIYKHTKRTVSKDPKMTLAEHTASTCNLCIWTEPNVEGGDTNALQESIEPSSVSPKCRFISLQEYEAVVDIEDVNALEEWLGKKWKVLREETAFPWT